MGQILNNKKGWGVNAEVEKRPYHPVHKPQSNTGAHWIKPEAQRKTVEVLHSNERPDLTAVYGDAHPPKALSGVLRRFAFKYSENSLAHWFSLMFADRIDFIEGLFGDISKGKLPRIFGDGYRVDFKYNKKVFYFRIVKNIAVFAVILYLIF